MIVQPIDWLYIFACSVLFALGGADQWKFGSHYWRRGGIPLLTALFALFYVGFSWLGVAACFALFGGLTLGYGSSKPYWYKFLVGCAWALPSMVFGFTAWQLVLPAVWISLFALSNSSVFFIRNMFVWKAVEFAAGLFIALTFVGALK